MMKEASETVRLRKGTKYWIMLKVCQWLEKKIKKTKKQKQKIPTQLRIWEHIH